MKSTGYQTITLLFALILSFGAASQDSLPTFHSPLEVPLILAGNFGEIRSGHFHAGIDIKTQQVEGLAVLAAETGYISRIKITHGGYGNALYITHPNGYTTVYAHLQKFNDVITQRVRQKQYQDKKFTVDLFLGPTALPVQKGERIATSGNSGGSGGPHLHFEIRKTATNSPVNPLLFGFKITDTIKPIIKHVALYPMNDTSTVNGKHDTVVIAAFKKGTNYKLKGNTPKAQGVIGVGIETIDKLNGASNRCGAYEVKLSADSQLIYQHKMDEIPFSETRFINTHVDFYQWKKHKKRIQKSFSNSYNKLSIYDKSVGKGNLYFSKYDHDLFYEVYDAYQNKSTLAFTVKADTQHYAHPVNNVPEHMVDYKNEFNFKTDQVHVHFPPYATYYNRPFNYHLTDTLSTAVAGTHHIQTLYHPLQKAMSVSIYCPADDSLAKKLYAVSLTSKLEVLSPEGGTYRNNWITFRTRSLGPYTVMIDTIAPEISPANFTVNNYKSAPELRFQIVENESGIGEYYAELDGQWHLVQIDVKTQQVWLDFTYHTPSAGSHNLKLYVTDAVGNISVWNMDFIW